MTTGSAQERLSVAAVAAELDVSKSTVQRLIRDRHLAHMRIRGRVWVTRAQLDEYLAASVRPAAWEQPPLPGMEIAS